MRERKLLLTVVATGVAMSSLSQSACLSAGGDASGAGGSISFSIGQVDYVAVNGANGSVFQGVQQPFELFDIIGVAEVGATSTMSVFPNPATTSVQVMVNGDLGNTYLDLYDAVGKLISTTRITSLQTNLDLQDMANGIYFMKLRKSSGEELESIKLIKTH
jgi:Secretion system C-terminal sorting domain